MNIKDSLMRKMKEKGLKVPATANLLGIPKDRIYKWFQEGTNPKEEDATKIWNWINGEKVPHENTLQESTVNYGSYDDSNTKESRNDFDSYLKKRQALKNNGVQFKVPLVPVAAQAGYAKSFLDPVFIDNLQTYPILPGIDPHGTQWRYFEVQGDSMEETFKEGQYLLASQVIKEDWKDINNFYVYVIITDDRVMVKRLAKVKGKDYWACISDNEARYPQFALKVAEVRELWKYRRHIDWDASPKKKFEVKV